MFKAALLRNMEDGLFNKLMIFISMSVQAGRSGSVLSTACNLYITNINAFSHAHVVSVVAFAGVERNMKAGWIIRDAIFPNRKSVRNQGSTCFASIVLLVSRDAKVFNWTVRPNPSALHL